MRSLLVLVALSAACAGDDPGLGDTDTVGDDPVPADTEVLETGDTAVPDSDVTTTWPTSPDDYVFDATTYLASLVIPGVDGDGTPTCCRDWGLKSRDSIEDGTDLVDNAVARFNHQLVAFVDLQSELDTQIQQGSVELLLEHHGLPPAGDGAYDLAVFVGEFGTATGWPEASAGTGRFVVWDSYFSRGTGRPAIVFNHATITGSQLLATGDAVTIPIPLPGAPLMVPAKDVTLMGTVDRTNGLAITEGSLSGYVRLDDFYQAYNDLVSGACGCAGLTGPLFTRGADGWTSHCVKRDQVVQGCGYYGMCPYLLGDSLFTSPPGFCAFVAPLVPGLADLDLDGDPSAYEAFSLGLRIEGVPATIEGIVPPPF